MKGFLQDYVVPLGVVLTFFVGVYNIYTIRKNLKSTKYIDTITTERIKWLNILRDEISEIVSIISESLIFYGVEIKNIEEENPNEDKIVETNYELLKHYFDANTSNLLVYKKSLGYAEIIKKLYILKLRFNPKEDIATLNYIQFFIDFYNQENINESDIRQAKNNIELLTENVQSLLKKEWEKVKKETINQLLQ